MASLATASFREHALLLVAHGSARHPEAARGVQAHAAALREAGVFAQVGVGLLHGEPAAAAALAGLRAPVVHVVPFFMEAGWFTRIAVPRALGLHGSVMQRGEQTLRYTAPIGAHAGMAALIGQRVRQIAPEVPALLVVGHGSARAPGRVTALHGHVARLTASGSFAVVEPAFLEEPPFIADAMARLRGGPLAVIGFFAGEGGHVRDDLPRLIAAEDARRASHAPLLDCGTVAAEPGIRRIILEQVAASA